MRTKASSVRISSAALAIGWCWAILLVLPCVGQERRGGRQERPRGTVERQAGSDADRLTLPPSVTHEADIEYARAGQRPLLLDLLRPTAVPPEKLPAIVFIHGGGWRNGDKSRNLPRLVHFVESGEYVCFSIGYRLSGEAPWPAQIHDCKAAVRFIRANAARFHIDPERIGVMGPSAGGHLVAMLGVCQDPALEGTLGVTGVSSRVRCVASLSPATDLAHWDVEPNEGARQNVEQLLGAPWGEAGEKAAAASPITYVTSDAPPFLIVHCRQDPSVPFAQAERLAVKLKAAGVDTMLVPVESALHGVTLVSVGGKPIEAFFAKYLRNEDVAISTDPITPPARERAMPQN